MKKNIFIPVVGQFTNVGDAMHRKELIGWLKGAGTLHVYIGNAPKHFVDALDIPSNAKLYKSLLKWLFRLLFSPVRKTHFIFNPGEITLGNRRLIGECILLPFQLSVKLKGGKVLRIGIAAMSNIKISNASLWRFLLRKSNKVYWRTKNSRDSFACGEVIPDLAFASTDLSVTLNTSKDEREYLVISMRSDRPEPSTDWFNAVRDFGKSHNLKFAVVSQVRMDNSRGQYIANKLNAETYFWDEVVGHLKQEEIVRTIYSKAKLVISDRLHVLIAAASEGVIPCVVLTQPSDKVKHHFDVIQLHDISSTAASYNEIISFLYNQYQREVEVRTKVQAAQGRLLDCKSEVLNLLH